MILTVINCFHIFMNLFFSLLFLLLYNFICAKLHYRNNYITSSFYTPMLGNYTNFQKRNQPYLGPRWQSRWTMCLPSSIITLKLQLHYIVINLDNHLKSSWTDFITKDKTKSYIDIRPTLGCGYWESGETLWSWKSPTEEQGKPALCPCDKKRSMNNKWL